MEHVVQRELVRSRQVPVDDARDLAAVRLKQDVARPEIAVHPRRKHFLACQLVF